jgi:hypothetical protein
MKKTIVAFIVGVALGVGILIGISSAGAGEEDGRSMLRPYYIYRDASGGIVIGNQTPPAGAAIIKRYDWIDATDAEIAQTARDNRAAEARLMERERILAADKLAGAIIEANALRRSNSPEMKALSVEVLNFPPHVSKLGPQRFPLTVRPGTRR